MTCEGIQAVKVIVDLNIIIIYMVLSLFSFPFNKDCPDIWAFEKYLSPDSDVSRKMLEFHKWIVWIAI